MSFYKPIVTVLTAHLFSCNWQLAFSDWIADAVCACVCSARCRVTSALNTVTSSAAPRLKWVIWFVSCNCSVNGENTATVQPAGLFWLIWRRATNEKASELRFDYYSRKLVAELTQVKEGQEADVGDLVNCMLLLNSSRQRNSSESSLVNWWLVSLWIFFSDYVATGPLSSQSSLVA